MSPAANAAFERAFMAIRDASAGLPELTRSSSPNAVIEAWDRQPAEAGRATVTITVDDLICIVAESRWN